MQIEKRQISADMAQKSQMSDGAADFHEMIRKVYEENKYKEERKDDKNYDDHIEDLFHPDNIFNRSRNFPTIETSTWQEALPKGSPGL